MTLAHTTVVCALALFALAPQDEKTAQLGSNDLAKLAWMTGAWEAKNGNKTTVETWLPLHGNTLFGVSQVYDEHRTYFFEYLRVAANSEGIDYIAMPGGAPATAFRLVSLQDGELVFENPKHDHPQRIRYQKTEQGLTATISMLDGSRASAFVFTRRDAVTK